MQNDCKLKEAPFEASEYSMVKEFHEAMGQPIGVVPCKEEKDLFSLRMMLIQEEYKEGAESCSVIWPPRLHQT